MSRSPLITCLAVCGLAAGCNVLSVPDDQADVPVTESAGASYVVQGDSLEAVRDAVRSVRAAVTQEFGSINAVGVTLTLEQLDALNAVGGLTILADVAVDTAGESVLRQRLPVNGWTGS